MAKTSWPFASQATTETQFSQLFSAMGEFGVAGQPSDTALKVTGDSTGMNVKVAAGFALVRGFAFYSTAQETLTVSASATSPRIDLVVLRLDPSVDSVDLAVVAGTPAATPVAPSLTQNTAANGGVYELEIGRILVGANVITISPTAVTDTRPFLGTPVGRWTADSRPASPKVGHLGLNTSTSMMEYWNGTAWTELSPSSIDASVITSGTLAVARIPNLDASKITTGTITRPVNAAVSGDVTTTNLHVDGKKIVVSASAPTGLSAGDIWIDIS
jgi:hypothetical protein